MLCALARDAALHRRRLARLPWRTTPLAPCRVVEVVMDELIEFLRAQLDEDERVAKAAKRFWHGVSVESATMAEEDHVRRFHPDRVLAEVDAKRRILDRYQAQLDRQGDWQESQMAADICAVEYADWILPVLALPYADREGYRSEWAP